MKIKEYDDKTTFFASDTHFSHKSIIELCNRPFASVEEMNNALIENWNKKVLINADVFLLGDFCFGGQSKWKEIFSKLNGRIHLIIGNHDIQSNGFKCADELFEEVVYQKEIKVNDRILLLSHYPFLTWGGENKGVINLHGHLHTNPFYPPMVETNDKQYDVGVDNNNYGM